MAEKLMRSSDKQIARLALASAFRSNRLRHDRIFFSGLDKQQHVFLAKTKSTSGKKPAIEVYSCRHLHELPGYLLKSKKGIYADKDAQHVFNSATDTWKLYYEIFGRNSVDGAGLVLRNSIHYGNKYDNAMWNGSQMVYGDGDGKIFGSFTNDIDVIGHELTHGVTQYSAKLNYQDQSGALNESMSDIFGIMVKQRTLNQDVKGSNWLIGENVLLGKQYALRSLAAPGTAYINHPQLGTDPQPATMDHFINTMDDHGGVHLNSGIPNHAFYLAAHDIGGFAWEKTGKVWYAALTKELKPDAVFADAKEATIKQATLIFGAGSLVVKAVVHAWKGVNV
jgi:Zn-dependent metalloprotease